MRPKEVFGGGKCPPRSGRRTPAGHRDAIGGYAADAVFLLVNRHAPLAVLRYPLGAGFNVWSLGRV